jgi:hypothetical protein
VRRAWAVVGSTVAALTLGWGTLQIVSRLAHAESTIELTYAAADVSAVDVQVDSGRIRVVASPNDTVRVTARISHGLSETGHSQVLEGDHLALRGDCNWLLSSFCSVQYTVEVPAGVSVHARTQNDDVVVTGIDGSIDARSGNGDVRVEGGRPQTLRIASSNGTVRATDVRAADVDASSSNGDVHLTLAGVPDSVRARSSNGDVDVVVPEDRTTYAVDAGSGNGGRAVTIRTDPTAPRTITARSSNGDVTVSYPAS